MRIVVDQLETNCKNCMFRDYNFSIQGPICTNLNCKLKPDDEGNERPVVGIEKCNEKFITFKEIMKAYISGEFDSLSKLTDNVKESEEKKIDLVHDDGYLGKVKESPPENSTDEERKLVTIGEEIRSYKNRYYSENKSD